MAINKEVDFFEKISSEVKDTFLKFQDAMKNRETQLLRQIEVLGQHYKLKKSYDKCSKEVELSFDNKNDLLNSIATFGRINFNGFSYESEVFKIEDYQKPEIDHVSLYKNVEKSSAEHPNKINIIDNNKLKQLCLDNELGNVTAADKLLTEIHSHDNNFVLVPNVILKCIEKDDQKLCRHFTKNNDLKSETCVNSNQDFVDYKPLSKNNTKGVSNCDNKNETTSYQCVCNASAPDMKRCISSCDKKSKAPKENEININVNINNDKLIEQFQKIGLKQPIQVQQWMKQIISETEIEPTPNNVMEHNHIEKLHQND